MSDALLQCMASAPRGFGDLLARELTSFGGTDVRERGNAVSFTGTLEVAYRACIESRVASRVYIELARLDVPDDATLYAALREMDHAGVSLITVESLPDSPVWAAVADRLRRAVAGAGQP